MPIKTIYDNVFRVRVTFIFDVEDRKKEILETLKKWTTHDLSHRWDCAGFVCSSDDHQQEFYLVIPRINNNNWLITTTLAHECLHITASVLRAMDVQLTAESEETFTYYLTWLMEELTLIYNKHQKRVKPMKAKTNIKKAISNFAKKDKKEDMKMIKSAIKKSDAKSSGNRK